MEKQWFSFETVPTKYAFPPELRPGKQLIPICDTIPVIDLGNAKGPDRTQTIRQILEAGRQFGFFQVTNHGVSEDLISETVRVSKEFFNMPAEAKASVPGKNGWIYLSSTDYAKDGVFLWRENIKLTCHPLEDCMQGWPQNPPQYREVVAAYLVEIGKLSEMILDLISDGLELEPGYLKKSSQVQLLSTNIYPPCPDPSLTLGILKHRDPSFITIVYQGHVSGLQVLKDGQWMGVAPIPNAFVINIGNQLEIVSNGELRSAEHRAVTNSKEVRTTITMFRNPCADCMVEPAKALVNELKPPLYKPALYKEFVYATHAFGPDTNAIRIEGHSRS